MRDIVYVTFGASLMGKGLLHICGHLLHRELLLSLTISRFGVMQSISNVCVIPQVNQMIYEKQ